MFIDWKAQYHYNGNTFFFFPSVPGSLSMFTSPNGFFSLVRICLKGADRGTGECQKIHFEWL